MPVARLALHCTAALALLLPPAAGAAVYTVTNTNDSGSGSLREAITAANANDGFDEIHFAIPGSGVRTIALSTILPGINDPVLIDGYTQPGAGVNTAGVGTNARLLIELRPAATLTTSLHLLVGSGGSTIRGLVVNRFNGPQINVTAGGIDCVITGNFIGTDPEGTSGYPGASGTRSGITVAGDRCRVGGPARADRNLISGLSSTGIYASGDDVVIQGNLVGTVANGGAALGNFTGISVGSTGGPNHDVTVGGIPSGSLAPANVVAGNRSHGIRVISGTGHRIEGNLIGLAAFPIGTIPNGGDGIRVDFGSLLTLGSAVDGGGNAIVGNEGAGIFVASQTGGGQSQGVFIVRNTIYGNGGLPIDLAPNFATGVTPNDPLDADDGPNSLQNFPVLGPVTYTSTETRIRGRLHSSAGDAFRIDVYRVGTCDPSRHGGASSHLGVAGVITDEDGNAEFEVVVPSILDSGFATATASRATDLATSEFSACLALGDRIFADGFDV